MLFRKNTNSQGVYGDFEAMQNGGLDDLHAIATIDYRYELVRKGIHLSSLSIPIIYYFMDKKLALDIILPITAAFVIVDLARYYIPGVSAWFYKWFGWLLRHREKDVVLKRLNGASTVLIAASICIFLFPKIITINAILILIISDTTSALVGRRWGRHRFLSKSLEGSLSFLVSAILVVLIAPKVDYNIMEYVIGLIAAMVGTIIEALSLKLDDNLTIPIGVGIVLWALYKLFLPELVL